MSGRALSLLGWWLVAGATLAVAVLSAWAPSGVPRLGTVVRRLCTHPGGRVLLVLGWMWLGWHAFAR